MLDNFDSYNETSKISDKDLFTKIWTSPRLVFKWVNENNYDKYVVVLLFLSGIARAFDRASTKSMGDNMSLSAIIGLSLIFGGLFGWISNYIYAALVYRTGKWLDGQGNTSSILRALSYAMIPSILSLICLIIQIGFFGIEIFKQEGDVLSGGLISKIFFYGSLFVEIVLGIWTLILCVIGISETQNLSVGKSILNLLLPILIILVPVLMIVLLSKLF